VASLAVSGEGRVALAAEDAAAETHVQPDRGRFVDQHHALAVGVVQHVLGVRVVRCTERVGTDPAQQLEVVHQEGVIVAFADHRQVLVLAEPGEVERLAVDQKADPVDGDGADADALVVAVHHLVAVDELQLEVVEVAVAGRPAVHRRDPQRAAGPRCRRRPRSDAPGRWRTARRCGAGRRS